ncbi:MAG: PIG-L family deacetylase [Anaerolineae bacterium]|nr:PIG-L family deacetylase [Anaerolineae bacterium]NIN99408.1 PIG-L family deacetylase [Anaerolineae bacterium]NIQ82273.1 PIG-L family deacetylase [Anaerolineae bacterium]
MVPDVVYLSPHLDDAVLSCGASIHRQAQAGRGVLVLTIFSGSPSPPDISPLAAQLHVRWGGLANPMAVRRREDDEASRLLHAHCWRLEYLDAIYRHDGHSFLYERDDDLFGSLHPSDLELATRVADSILEICSGQQPQLFAPLGVGNHVDHQLVREAVLTLRGTFRKVVFYEDYPYVEVPGALTQALEGICVDAWESQIRGFGEECLTAKIDAIATYASQVHVLFESAEMMATRVRDYTAALSSEQDYGERYWFLAADKMLNAGLRPA